MNLINLFTHLIVLLNVIEEKTKAAKIVLLPFPWPSHYFQLEKIGLEVERRGHDVTVLISSTESYKNSLKLKKVVYHVSHLPNDTFINIAKRKLQHDEGFGIEWLKLYSLNMKIFGSAVLESRDATSVLLNASLIVSDTAFLTAPVIADYFGIPHVSVSPWGHLIGPLGDALANVETPSYIPVFDGTSLFDRIGLADRMNFIERSYNAFAFIGTKILRKVIVEPALNPLIDNYTDKSFTQLWAQVQLILVPMDFSIEFPRPIPPMVKMIGPLTVQPATALPQTFSDIVGKSNEGVIVVSFGSMDTLHDKWMVVLLKAFLSGRFNVIWRFSKTRIMDLCKRKQLSIQNNECYCTFQEIDQIYHKDHDNFWLKNFTQVSSNKTEMTIKNNLEMKFCEDSVGPLRIGKNLHIFDWIPQNDILGHSKTKLFISHCGTNGVYEAVYQGVPVICIPLFGDQFDNAGRVKARKIGTAVRIADLSEAILAKIIEETLRNPIYLNTIKRISKRLRYNKESAAELATKWIDVVLAEGGDMKYLRPVGADLPHYIYFSLDLMFLWSLFTLLLILSGRYLFLNFLRRTKT